MRLLNLLSRLFGHTPASESGQEVEQDIIQSRKERAEVLRQQNQNQRAMFRYLGIEADVVTRRRRGPD